ncbi:MAG: iron-sulfur cluster assembly scaffold protein [Anaerolineae bacterium]
MNPDESTDFDRLVRELQSEIARREQELYSETVLREARNPQNLGSLPDADLYGAVRGWCGDSMEITMRLNGGTIKEASFTTDGCGATLACGSMLTQMLTGMTLADAEWVLPEDLVQALDGLPEESMHCAGLAVSTLHNALFNWHVAEMEQQEEAD